MLTKFRKWRIARLEKKALPTLRALITPDGHYYGRSVQRLWLDGGSVAGFRACVRLGWAEWVGSMVDREALGRPTNLGRVIGWAAQH